MLLELRRAICFAGGANVIGLDTHRKMHYSTGEKWGLDCEVSSIHKTKFCDETFDAVLIMGGLHRSPFARKRSTKYIEYSNQTASFILPSKQRYLGE